MPKGLKGFQKGNTGFLTPEHYKIIAIKNSGPRPELRGRTPWNKGLPGLSGKDHPMYGKKHSDVAREKMSSSHIGLQVMERSGLWKGGRKSWWRKEVMKRDNYQCQHCGNLDHRVLEVDHIKSKSLYPELQFDIKNGIVLCANCHAIKTLEDKELREKKFIGRPKKYG